MYVDKHLVVMLFCIATLLSGCGGVTQAEAPQQPKATTHAVQKPTPTPTVSVSVVSTPASAIARPRQLLIPAIGVNASVEDVGIASNGDLATPTKNPWDGVGWYDNGPRPGEVGSAVIDGHLDRPGGAPAVFRYLRNLQAGDEVLVIDAQGKATRFRVTRVASYPPQQAPLQEIFGTNDGRHLNLITCAGNWIPSQRQTTLRLVVYTTIQ